MSFNSLFSVCNATSESKECLMYNCYSESVRVFCLVPISALWQLHFLLCTVAKPQSAVQLCTVADQPSVTLSLSHD